MNTDALRHVLEDYQSLPEYTGVTITDVNQLSLFGDHPINVAATRGSIDELGVLLANGANLNASGEHGYTPLHNAVEQGKKAAVQWLMENGADVSLKNDNGETPESLARLLDEGEIAELLAGFAADSHNAEAP